jgi:hypothetical protein
LQGRVRGDAASILPHAANRLDLCQTGGVISALTSQKKVKGEPMGEFAQFLAMPIDLTDQGLVAGEAFKCKSPQSAIDHAKGYWQVLGHAGAVAFVRTGYPHSTTTVLRRFGSVPDTLEI